MKQWNLKNWRKAGAIIGKNVVAIDSFIDRAFPYLVVIGDNTVLTGTTILAHDASMYPVLGYSKIGVTTIGRNCFLGHGSVILAGVTVGDNCIIGAGAVISSDIPENSVVVGNNEIVCTKDEFIKKHKKRMKGLAALGIYPLQDRVTDKKKQKKIRKMIKEFGGYAK